jgi:hypothetical protein
MSTSRALAMKIVKCHPVGISSYSLCRSGPYYKRRGTRIAHMDHIYL